jgi:Xaa-Pro aminopeptidase
MDVHDVGDYKVGGEWRVLESGMALTVEPGIYIRPSPRIPKEFWNIGIRIEDDVLVTNSGPEVLTAALAKTPDAVESLVGAP